MSELRLKVTPVAGAMAARKGDALFFGVYDGGVFQESFARAGEAVTAFAARLYQEGWFRGKPGEVLLLPVAPEWNLPYARLGLLGLGKPAALQPESFRHLGGVLANHCNKAGIRGATVALALDKQGEVKRGRVAEALAEGASLGSYRFDEYRGDETRKEEPEALLSDLEIWVQEEELEKIRERLERVRVVAGGVFFARDLANRPGNAVTPEALAETARQLASRLPLKLTALGVPELMELGYGGILGVGQGSVHPPRLLVLEYENGGNQAPVAIVGKGVTFDSGGISIKPAAGMEDMKYDMSGAAAVFGVMKAVAELGLPVNLVGIVPTAENMPSGTAQRPGDILRTGRGVFVEVVNTDAEGRLILADALHHAERFQPRAIIDLATLTGACVVALGSHASGLMGNDEGLQEALRAAGNYTGERVWSLPLFDEYQEQIKSTVADVKNSGSREAGAITGACFLSRFVDKKRPWAHVDIAGTAADNSGKKGYVPKGASGVGVRLLCRYLEREIA